MAGVHHDTVVIVVTSVAGGVAFVFFLFIVGGLIWLMYRDQSEKPRSYPSVSRQSMDDLFMSYQSNTPPPYYDGPQSPKYYNNEAFRVGSAYPGSAEPATRPSSWTHIDTHSPYAIPRPKASSRSSLLYDDSELHYGARNPNHPNTENQLSS